MAFVWWGAGPVALRRISAAAPLKLALTLAEVARGAGSPPHFSGGPIEATRCQPVLSARARALRRISAAAPLKRDERRAAHLLGEPLRRISAAAPLKRALGHPNCRRERRLSATSPAAPLKHLLVDEMVEL